MSTVYISIGNSDDKLTQARWCEFVGEVEEEIEYAFKVHGAWFSRPDAVWQNACWCIDMEHASPVHVLDLRQALAVLASDYEQDSIAWAECSETEFLSR